MTRFSIGHNAIQPRKIAQTSLIERVLGLSLLLRVQDCKVRTNETA